jgi:hypothetical protein
VSIRHIESVLDHYGGKPSVKLVLVVLANHADAATGQCWPSYATIAAQCGVSRATAMRNVHALISEGVVEIVEHGGVREDSSGRPMRRANAYLVRLDRLDAMSTARQRSRKKAKARERERDLTCNRGGASSDTTPVASVAPVDGRTADTPTVLACEPSDEASFESSARTSLRSQRIRQRAQARRAISEALEPVKATVTVDNSGLEAACRRLAATYGAKSVEEALPAAMAYAQRRGEPLTARTIGFVIEATAEEGKTR